MNSRDILVLSQERLKGLVGHEFQVLELTKPVSPSAAVNLSKIVSKLSPLVGNLIEFNTCEYLNDQPEFKKVGQWRRQDPGFPDTIFDSPIKPTPGFEIKAWFPLATEITARFKDSQSHFLEDQTYVAMLAWLPEFLIFGKPKIIDIVIVSGASVAKARDDHYHNPPDYIVLEPEDTSSRTSNLLQTTTSGLKFQGTAQDFIAAKKLVDSWGEGGVKYLSSREYQALLRELTSRFKYRPDTNFAKMDRIVHAEIEEFKTRVCGTRFHGHTVSFWTRLLSRGSDAEIATELGRVFDIRDVDKPVVT
jgi:hypothetical protein